jgi:hypothetical protein
MLSYPLVGYTIGLMQSTNLYFNDFTVSAVFLLLLLTSTDSLTACDLAQRHRQLEHLRQATL